MLLFKLCVCSWVTCGMDKCISATAQVYPDNCTSATIYIMQAVLLKDKGEVINSCGRSN